MIFVFHFPLKSLHWFYFWAWKVCDAQLYLAISWVVSPSALTSYKKEGGLCSCIQVMLKCIYSSVVSFSEWFIWINFVIFSLTSPIVLWQPFAVLWMIPQQRSMIEKDGFLRLRHTENLSHVQTLLIDYQSRQFGIRYGKEVYLNWHSYTVTHCLFTNQLGSI